MSVDNNTRDYDKNPVILDNYEYEIHRWFGLFVAFFSFFIVYLFNYFIAEDKPINTFTKHIKTKSFTDTDLYFGFVYLFISLIMIAIVFLKHDKNNKIYLKKDKAVFVNLNKKYEIQREIDKDFDFYRPFFHTPKDNTFIVLCCVILITSVGFEIFIGGEIDEYLRAFKSFCKYAFAFIISNIIFKILIFKFINSNLKYFSLFPIICIAEPIKIDVLTNRPTQYGGYRAPSRHYFVFIYNNKVKQEVKEYFYNNYKIDIDKIKRGL